MFTSYFSRLLLLVVAILVLWPDKAAGQISTACVNSCGANNADCQAACQLKLNQYKTYMSQLSAGVSMHTLPSYYVTLLQPFYPTVSLNSWRFGFADRQPPGNATTDCTRTYFNSDRFVDRLKAGALKTDQDLHWLFHELRHFPQCVAAGGRDAYAVMWFNQLELTFIQSSDLATLHDRMPMEANADAVADSVLANIAASRNPDGSLHRPGSPSESPIRRIHLNHNGQPALNIILVRQNAGQTFEATATGFSTSSPPIRWAVEKPNGSSLALTGRGTNGNKLQWAPLDLGMHTLKVTAGDLPQAATLTKRISVVDSGVAVPGQPVRDHYETVSPLPAGLSVPLTVTVNSSRHPVLICVTNKLTGELYGIGQINSTHGNFRVPKFKKIKIVISGNGPNSGMQGQSRELTMDGVGKSLIVSLSAGSGGPQCGGIQ